jgi:hypothetical protein
MNPILQTLVNQSPQVNQIKQMFNMFKSAQNPQALLNNMASQNPQLKQVMEAINQHGGDPKKAFYDIAKERGIDPDEILNQLK